MIFALVMPLHLFANDIRVEASFSETQVFTGERVVLKIEIRGNDFRNVTRPEIPTSVPGLRSVSVQPSTSTQYSIINGVATRTYSFSYTYVAESAGTFQFPAVNLNVDGISYNTEPIRLSVINRSDAARQGSSNLPEIFVKMELSDENPVVGQQVIAELTLYFKDPLEVVSYQTSNTWSTDGFWKEAITDGSTPRAESVILGGERYRKAVLLRHALFASRSGSLNIGAATVTTTIRTASRQSDPFSSFFGGFGTNQRTVDLKTEPISLNVRALPAPGVRNTIGAVGTFSITRRISPAQISAGEALEIITEVRGTGNLALINKPTYQLPESFEVFQPQETINLNRTDAGISGVRTFRDIVIVRRPGSYQIPEEEISWFDPERRRYASARLPAQTIQVIADANAVAGITQQRTLTTNPVIGVVKWSSTRQNHIMSHWWLYVGLLLPGLLIAYAWRKKQEDEKLRSDFNYARRLKAPEVAEKRLNEANALAESPNADVKTVMSILQTTLYGIITDRLSIKEAGHSDDDILELLREKDFPPTEYREIEKLLKKCSTIRFAPVIARENLTHEVEKTRGLVQKIVEVL